MYFLHQIYVSPESLPTVTLTVPVVSSFPLYLGFSSHISSIRVVLKCSWNEVNTGLQHHNMR